VFVKEVDSLIGVRHYPDCAKIFHFSPSSMSKHLEHWRNAVEKVKIWTLLSSECESGVKKRKMH